MEKGNFSFSILTTEEHRWFNALLKHWLVTDPGVLMQILGRGSGDALSVRTCTTYRLLIWSIEYNVPESCMSFEIHPNKALSEISPYTLLYYSLDCFTHTVHLKKQIQISEFGHRVCQKYGNIHLDRCSFGAYHTVDGKWLCDDCCIMGLNECTSSAISKHFHSGTHLDSVIYLETNQIFLTGNMGRKYTLILYR